MNQTGKIGMSETFFFDTYAFFEVIRGNLNYEKYIDVKFFTTIFNLAELNYNLKKEKDKKVSDLIIDKYSSSTVEVIIEDVKEAMDFKTMHRQLSIPDAIGYTIAKRLGVKFLTGDEDFRGMDNVEFVK